MVSVVVPKVPFVTTETYPQSERIYHHGPDMITAIRVYGTDIELALVNGQDIFTLGRSPDICDLCVNCQYLAPVHVRLERVPNSSEIRVTNVSSGKNHIVYKAGEARMFHILAGESFVIGETRYIALNDEMRLARPPISEVFGAKRHSAIDDLLIAAIEENDSHIVLVGEPGCEQGSVAGSIHHVSRRRRCRFIEVEPTSRAGSADRHKIEEARGGTLILWLPSSGRFDPRFIEAATHRDARARLIVCAHSLKKAQASFPDGKLRNVTEIHLAPLRSRRDEIPGLLDKCFVRNESPLRFELLKEEVRQRLVSYSWEDNLRELRTAAVHLGQLSHYKSERQATKDTSITRKASRYWRAKVGFPLPIVE
jgi:hypothetical protein